MQIGWCWRHPGQGPKLSANSHDLARLAETNLSSEVGSTSLGHLDDNWRLRIASSLKGSNNSRRRSGVLVFFSSCKLTDDHGIDKEIGVRTHDSRNSEFVFLRVFKELFDTNQLKVRALVDTCPMAVW